MMGDDDRENCDSTEEEYEVEAIRDERQGEDGVTEYLVKWVDYDSDENTWEKAEAFERGGQQILVDWENQKQVRLREQEMGSGAVEVKKEACQEEGEVTMAVEETIGELKQQMNNLNNQLFERLEKAEAKVAKAEEREEDMMYQLKALKREVRVTKDENLKLKEDKKALEAENRRLVQEMKNLEIFKLCQKDPEKNLRKQIKTLEEQRHEARTRHDHLKEKTRDRLVLMEGLEKQVKEQEKTLKLVADFLGVVLQETVTKDQIRQKLRKAEEVFMEMKGNAEEATVNIGTLEEVATFLGEVLDEDVSKSQLHEKLNQAREVFVNIKKKAAMIDQIVANTSSNN